jgi:hypothetical protein
MPSPEGAVPLAEALRDNLQKSLGPVFFTDFRGMLARDQVFVVAATLTLVECGVAIAMDDVEKVQAWIGDGRLRKPSRAERDAWPKDASRQWMSLVVQPFVLLQEPADA